MMKRIARFHDLTVGNNLERSVFLGACGMIAVIFFSYAYMIGGITFGVVERRDLEAAMRETRNRLGALEVEYVAASRTLTLERARSLGLLEADIQVFASRKGDALGLSRR